MNGETYQAAHLVLCAGIAMKTKEPFHFEAEQYVQSVGFQSDLYTKQEEREQSTPDEWFSMQTSKGMTDIFLLLRTESTDRERQLMAFANAHPCMIVTKYGEQTTFWTSKWSFNQETKSWIVRWSETDWPNAPKGHPVTGNNTQEFRRVLLDLKVLANEIGVSMFANIFDRSVQMLDGTYTPEKPDQIISAYMDRRHFNCFMAASGADVFGGMGSWNDDPWYMASSKGKGQEYEKLSGELVREMYKAIMFAVNDTVYDTEINTKPKSKLNSDMMIPGTDPILMGKGSIVAIALGVIGIGFYIFLIMLWINDHRLGLDTTGLPILIAFGCIYLPVAVYVLRLGFRKKAQAREMKDEIFNVSMNGNTINLGALLFLIPVAFCEDAAKPEKIDYELHFCEHDARMYKQDIRIFCADLPKAFAPAKEPNAQLMHYQTLKSPRDGKRYMPLFTSYKIMTAIYGENIRVGVISFATARDYVRREGFDGIVFAPGVVDEIIPAEKLWDAK